MMQLWINLPAKHKMTKPSYQPILKSAIPSVELANKGGVVRVIAGSCQGVKGIF